MFVSLYRYLLVDALMAAAIHADPDAESLASGQPQAARILAALVGVDDLRRAMGFHGHLEHLYAVLLVQRTIGTHHRLMQPQAMIQRL